MFACLPSDHLISQRARDHFVSELGKQNSLFICLQLSTSEKQMELAWRCSMFFLLLTAGGVLANFDDIAGDYCGGPTQRCCDGRIDSCAIPILGTLCYCDQFCNRTDSSDCCPDYWSVCLGIEAPEPLIQQLGSRTTTQNSDLLICGDSTFCSTFDWLGCYHEGQRYSYGHTVRINCNKW